MVGLERASTWAALAFGVFLAFLSISNLIYFGHTISISQVFGTFTSGLLVACMTFVGVVIAECTYDG